jgi:hypothetical protein
MIYGQTGYSLGFGLELVNDSCGELPVKPVNRGTWLTKTSLYDYPPKSLIKERIRKLKED